MQDRSTPLIRHEIRALTGIRGLAALYVAIYHSVWPDWSQFNRNGYLAVDLFFVLSGYVMALSYAQMFAGGSSWRQYGIFLLRRLARIYPLYIFATCAFGLATIVGVIDMDGLQPPLWWPMLTNIFMVQAWGLTRSILRPLWSISTEWGVYLAFPILVAALLSSRWRVALTLVAIAFGALYVLSVLPKTFPGAWRSGPLDISWVGTPRPLIRCFAEFSIGLVAYRASLIPGVRAFASHPAAAPVLASAILGLLCLYGADLAIVALMPLFLITLAYGTGPVQAFLGWGPIHLLGELSFAIYVFHPRLGSFYKPPAAYLAQWIDYEAAWRISFFVVLITMAWLANRVIERPGRVFVRNLEAILFARPKFAKAHPANVQAT